MTSSASTASIHPLPLCCRDTDRAKQTHNKEGSYPLPPLFILLDININMTNHIVFLLTLILYVVLHQFDAFRHLDIVPAVPPPTILYTYRPQPSLMSCTRARAREESSVSWEVPSSTILLIKQKLPRRAERLCDEFENLA